MSETVNYNVAGVAFKTAGMSKHYRNYLVAEGGSIIIYVVLGTMILLDDCHKWLWVATISLFILLPIGQHYFLTKKTEISASELKVIAYNSLARGVFNIGQSILTSIFMAKGQGSTSYLITELILLQLDTALAIYQTHRLFKLSKLQKLMEEREPELV